MQALFNRWSVNCLARGIVELLDDRCGRAFRKEKCVLGHDVEVGKSLLVRGCQIRHERRAINHPCEDQGQRLKGSRALRRQGAKSAGRAEQFEALKAAEQSERDIIMRLVGGKSHARGRGEPN